MFQIAPKTYVQPYGSFSFKSLIAYILAGLEIGVLTIFIGWMMIAIVGKCIGDTVRINEVIQMSVFTLLLPVLQMAHAILLIIEANNNSSSSNFTIIFFIIAFYVQLMGFYFFSFMLLYTNSLSTFLFWVLVGYFMMYFIMGGYSIYLKKSESTKEMLEVFCVIGTVLQMMCQSTIIALEIYNIVQYASSFSTVNFVVEITYMVFALWQIADMVIIDVMIGKDAYKPKKIIIYLILSMSAHFLHDAVISVVFGIIYPSSLHSTIVSLLARDLFYILLVLLFLYITQQKHRLARTTINEPKVIPIYKYFALKQLK